MQHTARTAADDLRIVLDHWGHLRALIDTATPDTWPPTMGQSAYLHDLDAARDQADAAIEHAQHLLTRHDEHGRAQYDCAHCTYVGDGGPHTPRPDRDALQLGERPVPLRLHVVDACRAVEAALVACADEIAAEVQPSPLAPMRPVKNGGYTTAREARIAADDRDRRNALAARDASAHGRWTYTGGRTALRAAAWLLDQVDGSSVCTPLSAEQRGRIALVARAAAARIERTIGGSAMQRAVPMADSPCLYCGGRLTLHTGGDQVDRVTCEHGHECGAPVRVIEGRRTWATPGELAALQRELAAAAKRRKRADARARQRAAARARQGTAA